LHTDFLQHFQPGGEVNRDWLIPQAANQLPDLLKKIGLVHRHRM
jgi:hypothetical protein